MATPLAHRPLRWARTGAHLDAGRAAQCRRFATLHLAAAQEDCYTARSGHHQLAGRETGRWTFTPLVERQTVMPDIVQPGRRLLGRGLAHATCSAPAGFTTGRAHQALASPNGNRVVITLMEPQSSRPLPQDCSPSLLMRCSVTSIVINGKGPAKSEPSGEYIHDLARAPPSTVKSWPVISRAKSDGSRPPGGRYLLASATHPSERLCVHWSCPMLATSLAARPDPPAPALHRGQPARPALPDAQR